VTDSFVVVRFRQTDYWKVAGASECFDFQDAETVEKIEAVVVAAGK
jgi:hypothetical protein